MTEVKSGGKFAGFSGRRAGINGQPVFLTAVEKKSLTEVKSGGKFAGFSGQQAGINGQPVFLTEVEKKA